jgi:hypothetical protein
MGWTLVDAIPEGSRVVSDPSVPADDREELRRFSEFFGSRQVNRVERADRLRRKWPCDARENRVRHRDDVTTPREYLKRAHGGALVGGIQAAASCSSSAANRALDST